MRVQVNVADELVQQLDEYAKAVGLSRSALCGYFIGQGMFSFRKGLKWLLTLFRAMLRL